MGESHSLNIAKLQLFLDKVQKKYNNRFKFLEICFVTSETTNLDVKVEGENLNAKKISDLGFKCIISGPAWLLKLHTTFTTSTQHKAILTNVTSIQVLNLQPYCDTLDYTTYT